MIKDFSIVSPTPEGTAIKLNPICKTKAWPGWAYSNAKTPCVGKTMPEIEMQATYKYSVNKDKEEKDTSVV